MDSVRFARSSWGRHGHVHGAGPGRRDRRDRAIRDDFEGHCARGTTTSFPTWSTSVIAAMFQGPTSLPWSKVTWIRKEPSVGEPDTSSGSAPETDASPFGDSNRTNASFSPDSSAICADTATGCFVAEVSIWSGSIARPLELGRRRVFDFLFTAPREAHHHRRVALDRGNFELRVAVGAAGGRHDRAQLFGEPAVEERRIWLCRRRPSSPGRQGCGRAVL
jgi:hypothetical protein